VKISAIFSSVDAENEQPYNVSIYFKLWYYVEHGLISLWTEFEKNSSSGFLIPAQFKNFRGKI